MTADLESIAQTWLAQPELLPGFEKPRYARVLMRLWDYPALRGPWTSLVLYEPDSRHFEPPKPAPVCEVSWDRQADCRPPATPCFRPILPAKPTVTLRQARLPAEALARRYQALQALEFRPFSPTGPGTDGFTRGVEARLRFGSASISWWGPAPVGLEPLLAWYTETWDEVRSAIESGGAQGR